MASAPRKLIALLSALSLSTAELAPSFAVAAPGEVDLAACEVADEGQFRAAVERLTAVAIQNGVARIDFKAVVGDEWLRNGMGALVDRGVDKAVRQIKDEASWSSLLESLASKEAAAKLAITVAERTYRSDEMKAAIEDLAEDVGKSLANSIELATLDAAEPAVGCVRAFLGPRYGSTISLSVADDTGRAFDATAASGAADVSSGDVVLSGKGIIAGAVVLIVRRSLSNMAKRIGQRVVGVVLGRLVSVIAGGIGLILIAKDIWDLRNGVLPIVEAEMKSEDSKNKVQEEIANAISEQLGVHLKDVAAATADRILEVWQAFKVAHAKVVELAAKHPEFKAFLETVSRPMLPRVDRVVAVVLAGEGEAGALARLRDGTLDRAVKRMPDAGLDIATDTQSLARALDWESVAGADIGAVLANELHRTASPKDFTRASFKRLVSLGDTLVIQRLSRLPRDARESLDSLDPSRLAPLVRVLEPAELEALVRYLLNLKPDAGQRLLSAVADDPARMKSLGRGSVQSAVLSSRDQDAALGMLLRQGSLFDVLDIEADLRSVLDGAVSPMLLWEKHPAPVIAAGFLLLLLLLLLRRLLFVRRA